MKMIFHVSMYQIYNETVFDLLNMSADINRVKQNLYQAKQS